MFPKNLTTNIRGDFYGGLTGAVVALPLALAFGVASGAGPIAGLYSAIIVGFFAALFGGTPSQISGPTGPMTVVMTAIIMQYAHEPSVVFTIVLLAGLIQILFGLLKVGQYVAYVPYTVISGFMSGVGVIMMILQINVLFGYKTASGIIPAFTSIPSVVSAPVTSAVILGLSALAIMIFTPKKIKAIIPPPLIALICCTFAGVFYFNGAPVLGDVPSGLPQIKLAAFPIDMLPVILSSALTLAMLGSVDSLLTSLVADNFTKTRHRPNKELIGQGIGNMFAGLIGALPGAGATVRTVVNIKSGGRTPLSGMIHSIILLACTLGLGFLLEDIPRAVLAGILLKVGWDIIDWRFIKRLWQAGHDADKQATTVMLTVLFLTVFVDLIIAVAVGIVMECLISAKKLAQEQLSDVTFLAGGMQDHTNKILTAEEEKLVEISNDDVLFLKFSGALSFGSACDLTNNFNLYENNNTAQIVMIDITRLNMMDISIMVTFAEMIETILSHNKTIYLSGTSTPIFGALKRHGIISKLDGEKIFDSYNDALSHVISIYEEETQTEYI